MARYRYSTIKRGQVKVTSEKQHEFLHVKKLPHTEIFFGGKKKRVK